MKSIENITAEIAQNIIKPKNFFPSVPERCTTTTKKTQENKLFSTTSYISFPSQSYLGILLLNMGLVAD